MKKTNWTNWECPYCYNEKYPLPFANLDVDEISFLSFNSNLNCPCQYTQNKLPTNNLTMLLTSQTAKESIHTIDNIENDLEPKQNFKYYEVHDIHLLKDTIDINKQTSLLHTNICSLQANGDKLDILLKELDFKFDIIALSETWNPENKNHMFSPLHLEGYNNLTGSYRHYLKKWSRHVYKQ